MANWNQKMKVMVTVVALLFGSLSTIAQTTAGATLEGTIQVPCDPSRLAEAVAVRIVPSAGGPSIMAPVDPASGVFVRADLVAGSYDLIVLNAAGESMSPQPRRLVLMDGVNPVVLILEPPGCGEETANNAPTNQNTTSQAGLEEWKLSLIYVGAVGAAILAVDAFDDDDDDAPASAFEP